jgi:small-conductance mechanosensitive channel
MRAVRRHVATLRAQAFEAGRRARRQLLVLIPLLVVVVLAYVFRKEVFGLDRPIRLATAATLVVIGWALARNLGRALQPYFVRRLDPGAAGVAGFLVRLITLIFTVLVSLRISGLEPRALLLGASVTAVVVGLAAQQTVGNMLAGVVLLSARPFQVGDRVRFHGFGMDVVGSVAAHGLLYLTLTDGEDLIMVPNSTALAMSVRPLREPAAVDMRARLPATVDPATVQARVTDAVSVPTRDVPSISLEEFDGDEVTLRIRATPADRHQGGALAREILGAVTALRQERRPERDAGDRADGESTEVPGVPHSMQ